MILENLEFEHYLLFIAGIFALLPAFRLFQIYRKNRIVEYGMFSMVFLLSALYTVTIIPAEITNELLYWQLSFSFRNITYFLFFTHTVRMLWAKPSFSIVYPGVILYTITQLMIILWQPSTIGAGADFMTERYGVIYGTHNRLLGNIFQLYVAIFFLYGYLSIHLKKPNEKMQITFRIMIAVSSALLLSRVIRILQYFDILTYTFVEYVGSFFFMLSFILVAFVIYFNPGAIMVSRAQIDGILVISPQGTPISSMRMEYSKLSESSTLISGVMKAIQSVLGSIDDAVVLQEIDAGSRSILVTLEKDLYFMIVTNTVPTIILKNSLEYFSRIYHEEFASEITKSARSGKVINGNQINDIIDKAFPFTTGMKKEVWQ